MAKTKKIPVVKSHIVARRPKRKSRPFLYTAIVFTFALLLFHIWLQVKINSCLTELQELERENKRILEENDELQAEVVELSGYGRVHKIAQQIGLVFIPHEDILQLPE